MPIPFEGAHQAGIVTPAQDRLYFVALDMTSEERADLISLLKDWTAAARQMTQGNDVGEFGAVSGSPFAPPEDTGEALGLPPSGLTITVGFGRSLFVDDQGKARFGARRQAARAARGRCRPSPATARSGALRWRSRHPGMRQRSPGRGRTPSATSSASRSGGHRVRYSQMGFGRTSSTSTAQVTARNLFGFKDGTANIKVEDAKDVRDLRVGPTRTTARLSRRWLRSPATSSIRRSATATWRSRRAPTTCRSQSTRCATSYALPSVGRRCVTRRWASGVCP